MISLRESNQRLADRELERRVHELLREQHIPGARRVQVHAYRGAVTIQGRVRSYYQRQICGCCCRRAAGVVRVIDQIEVVDADDGTVSLHAADLDAGTGLE